MRARIVRVTVAAWLAIALLSEGVRIWVVLTGPPQADLYANSLSFQLVGSLYLLVIVWVPILAALLLLETLLFAAADRGWMRQVLAAASGLFMAAALYSLLWVFSSSSLAFTACDGRYSLSAESFRCRQPYVAALLSSVFFAASIACMWARSQVGRGARDIA